MKQITYSFPEDGSPYVKSLLEILEGIISAHNKSKGEVTLKDIEGYLKCHLCMCNVILDQVRISLINDNILTIDENLKCVMEIKI